MRDMSEEERKVLGVAIAHCNEKRMIYSRILGVRRLPPDHVDICKGLFGNRPVSNNLWEVKFEVETLPANVVQTHNSFSVVVDMDASSDNCASNY